MPVRRAALLVRLILQNNGGLSRQTALRSELKDEEISAIEGAVASLSKDTPST